MPMYLFQSTRQQITALTTDGTGQNLPPDKGPWSKLGDRMMPVGNTASNQFITGSLKDRGFIIIGDCDADARRSIQ